MTIEKTNYRAIKNLRIIAQEGTDEAKQAAIDALAARDNTEDGGDLFDNVEDIITDVTTIITDLATVDTNIDTIIGELITGGVGTIRNDLDDLISWITSLKQLFVDLDTATVRGLIEKFIDVFGDAFTNAWTQAIEDKLLLKMELMIKTKLDTLAVA
jgi:hypothetical protein